MPYGLSQTCREHEARCSTAWFIIDAMVSFQYRHRTMAVRVRARQLQQLIGRIERLIARGTAASSRFTTYRLAIFIAGTLTSITLFRSGQYHTGNIALAAFVILFLMVASYHNRLEQRIHRLRVWALIKSAHLARVQLAWSQVPHKPLCPRLGFGGTALTAASARYHRVRLRTNPPDIMVPDSTT
jgi:hypothetical protein